MCVCACEFPFSLASFVLGHSRNIQRRKFQDSVLRLFQTDSSNKVKLAAIQCIIAVFDIKPSLSAEQLQSVQLYDRCVFMYSFCTSCANSLASVFCDRFKNSEPVEHRVVALHTQCSFLFFFFLLFFHVPHSHTHTRDWRAVKGELFRLLGLILNVHADLFKSGPNADKPAYYKRLAMDALKRQEQKTNEELSVVAGVFDGMAFALEHFREDDDPGLFFLSFIPFPFLWSSIHFGLLFSSRIRCAATSLWLLETSAEYCRRITLQGRTRYSRSVCLFFFVVCVS